MVAKPCSSAAPWNGPTARKRPLDPQSAGEHDYLVRFTCGIQHLPVKDNRFAHLAIDYVPGLLSRNRKTYRSFRNHGVP